MRRHVMGDPELYPPQGRLQHLSYVRFNARLEASVVMRAYHLLSAENALSDIALGRVKIARLAEVNDPFELLAVNVGGQKQMRKALRQWKTFQNETKGILSFSKSWSNPALWSHYGAKHRGMCLGFDLADELIQRVNYVDQRVLAEFQDDVPSKFNKALRDALLCTKYAHWKYEEEVRVFVKLQEAIPEETLYFYPFSNDLKLRKVILGPLCEYGINDIRKLVTSLYASVIVIRARLAFKSFRVVPDKRTLEKQHGPHPTQGQRARRYVSSAEKVERV